MALYAFDGTWQSQDEPTNVTRFLRRYEKSRGKSYYFDGAGTRRGQLGRAFGGWLGFGTKTRAEEALQQLGESRAAGDDTVDVVGYSRGAAAALMFAWAIDASRWKIPEKTKVRFLGLWDTVFYQMSTDHMPLRESFKVIFFSYARYEKAVRKQIDWVQRLFGGPDLAIPPNVDHVFHAMALHERSSYLMGLRVEKAHEVWFAGSHSDVGGQSENRQLSNLTLDWMADRARSCGMSMVHPPAHPVGKASAEHLQWGEWRRDVRDGDLMHRSVPGLAEQMPEAISNLVIENAATGSGDLSDVVD